MEHIGSSSNAPSEGSPDASKEKSTEEEVFVNHGEIAWHQMREEWVGDQSKKSQRPPTSLQDKYDDMFSSNEPFDRPIPLAVMVNILVQKWEDEGFYEIDILN